MRLCSHLVTLLALTAPLLGCTTAGSSADRGRAARGAIAVAVERVAASDLARQVTVAAPVEPIRSVSVSSQAAGTVLEVLVEEGSRVQSGAPLATLDARETSAQLERARAVLVNAEATFQRSEQLRARELASAADLDAARAAFGIAKADVELWRARLAFTRITAPVSGIVTAKRVERGSTVSENQVLFELADASVLVLRVRVSELDVVHLQPGLMVDIRLDAYPDARIEGRVRRIFPSADAGSRLVPVEIALGPMPKGVVARPGYLARAEFSLQRRSGVLTVPTSAVGAVDSSSYVYLVEADTLVRREVQTGMTAEGRVEVVNGLAIGERVVRSGHANLRPGMAVRVSGDSSRVAGAS